MLFQRSSTTGPTEFAAELAAKIGAAPIPQQVANDDEDEAPLNKKGTILTQKYPVIRCRGTVHLY